MIVNRTINAVRRRCRWITVAGFVAALLASGANRPGRHILPVSYTVVETTEAAVAPADVDVLGIWLRAARETHEKVTDYQGTLVKQERINGVLQEEQSAVLKLRVQPFSVHLKFIAPKSAAGREVTYVAGRNNGKIKARAGGAIGLVGFMTLDPHDPKAMQGTRHTITEAGIGNLIDRLSTAHSEARQAGPSTTQVSVSEATVARRTCVRIEVTDSSANESHHPYHSVIYFDKDTNLPIRFESYDRPRGGTLGELIECYTYLDLKFNVGLTDSAFGH
jgi:hypothetical protein